MFAERYPEFESRVESIAIHFPHVVVDPARAEHWAGDASVDRQVGGQLADLLRAGDDNLIRKDERLEFIQKSWECVDNLLCALHPIRSRIDSASAETHVITHHARTGKRLEKIENLLSLAERIHERRAPGTHVAQQKSQQRSVILKSRQFSENDAQIFSALRDFDACELLNTERVGPVVCH